MQIFSEQRFPEAISYGMTGGPEYSTTIIETISGHEYRNSNWAKARARYNIGHGVKTKEQLDELVAFFRACRGRATGFRFKDWTDFQGAGQIIGHGDGQKITFQLVKNYSIGSLLEVRIITKAVKGTVVVYVDNKPVACEVSYENGLVNLKEAAPLAAVITADFEFDVPVRFDTDRLNASSDNYGVYSWQDISLLEVI